MRVEIHQMKFTALAIILAAFAAASAQNPNSRAVKPETGSLTAPTSTTRLWDGQVALSSGELLKEETPKVEKTKKNVSFVYPSASAPVVPPTQEFLARVPSGVKPAVYRLENYAVVGSLIRVFDPKRSTGLTGLVSELKLPEPVPIQTRQEDGGLVRFTTVSPLEVGAWYVICLNKNSPSGFVFHVAEPALSASR